MAEAAEAAEGPTKRSRAKAAAAMASVAEVDAEPAVAAAPGQVCGTDPLFKFRNSDLIETSIS